MRHPLVTALVLGSLSLGGCDPTSNDDAALTLDPTTYAVPGPEEFPPSIVMNLTGLHGGSIKVPECPVPTPAGKFASIGRERLAGDTWVLETVTASCDDASVVDTPRMTESTPQPHIITGGPSAAGTYRFWLWIETPDGERKRIYTPTLTVVAE